MPGLTRKCVPTFNAGERFAVRLNTYPETHPFGLITVELKTRAIDAFHFYVEYRANLRRMYWPSRGPRLVIVKMLPDGSETILFTDPI